MTDRGDDGRDQDRPADPWGIPPEPDRDDEPSDDSGGTSRRKRRRRAAKRRGRDAAPETEEETEPDAVADDDGDPTEVFDSATLLSDDDAAQGPLVVDESVWAGHDTSAADGVEAVGLDGAAADASPAPPEADSPDQESLFGGAADSGSRSDDGDLPASDDAPRRQAEPGVSPDDAEEGGEAVAAGSRPHGVATPEAFAVLGDDDHEGIDDWESFMGESAVDRHLDHDDAGDGTHDEVDEPVPMTRRERRRARRAAKKAAKQGRAVDEVDEGVVPEFDGLDHGDVDDEIPGWVEGGPEDTAWLAAEDDPASIVGDPDRAPMSAEDEVGADAPDADPHRAAPGAEDVEIAGEDPSPRLMEDDGLDAPADDVAAAWHGDEEAWRDAATGDEHRVEDPEGVEAYASGREDASDAGDTDTPGSDPGWGGREEAWLAADDSLAGEARDAASEGEEAYAPDPVPEPEDASDAGDTGIPGSDPGWGRGEEVWRAADEPLVDEHLVERLEESEAAAYAPAPGSGGDRDDVDRLLDDEAAAWLAEGEADDATGPDATPSEPDEDISEDAYAQSVTVEHRGLAEEIFRAGDDDLEWQGVSAAMPGLDTGVVGFDDVADLGEEGDDYVAAASSDLGTRIATGLILIGLLLGSLWVGPEAFAAFVGLLVLIALVELYTTLRMRGLRPITLFGLLGGLGALVGAWFQGPMAIPAAIAFTTVATFFVYAFAPLSREALTHGGLTILGVVWIAGTAAFAMPLIQGEEFRVIVLLVIALTVAMDVGAYASGRMWGSTRLAPMLSPNKSVEGLIGGIVMVGTVGYGASLLFEQIEVAHVVWLSLVVVVLAPLGDLAESMIKRSLQVKDMGTILPGHGGVLDRIDAFLFVLPGAWVVAKVLDLIG